MMTIHDSLPPNGTDLNFDVDDTERLCANVDLNQPRVHGFVELSEAGDQTDRTLLHVFERIREWTARDCAK